MPYGQIAKAVLGVGGSIAGGIIGANAAGSAEAAQTAYQRDALQWIQQNYSQTQNNLQPYIGAGSSAVGSLLNLYGLPGGSPQGQAGAAIGAGGTGGPVGSAALTATGPAAAYNQFTQTPGYQFPLQQANLATNRALASSGLIGSGAQLRDLSQLNAGYASQGYGQFVQGIQGLATGGQQAATSLGQIGLNTGAQIGTAYTNEGNASAQGIYNTASSWNQMVQGIVGALSGNGGSGGSSNSSYGGGGGISSIMSMFGGSGGGGGAIDAGSF